jgi:hypothetical protein
MLSVLLVNVVRFDRASKGLIALTLCFYVAATELSAVIAPTSEPGLLSFEVHAGTNVNPDSQLYAVKWGQTNNNLVASAFWTLSDKLSWRTRDQTADLTPLRAWTLLAMQ